MAKPTAARWSTVFYLYAAALLGGSLCLWLITLCGRHLSGAASAGGASLAAGGLLARTLPQAVIGGLADNLRSPLASFILQILTILVAARLCGLVLRRFGQPRVMGEILAGILLGPSLLKPAFPQIHGFLFPDASLPRLFFLSNIGIILFMFMIGLELDLSALRSRAKSALLIAHLSTVFPLVLGAGLALFLYSSFGVNRFGFFSFALFMGVSMSVTAFPVLARIVQEQGLTRTNLGVASITSAAVGDVTAWCLLAVVVGIVQSGSATSAAVTVVLAAIYSVVGLFAVRPALQRWLPMPHPAAQRLARGTVALVLMILLASCLLTETIGIGAIFGAFLAGVIMPDGGEFKPKLVAAVEDVATLVLLPLFFAFVGLRTQIGLLNDSASWLVCGVIIAVAVIGKMGGAIAGARWTGLDWREAAGLGALMNTRGLVELVVLNIGYDIGILTPKIFTMLVIMAIVTTLMAAPLLRLFGILHGGLPVEKGRLADG